jgi:hypothetical protein
MLRIATKAASEVTKAADQAVENATKSKAAKQSFEGTLNPTWSRRATS